MLDDVNPNAGSSEQNPALRRLAEALGIPVMALSDATVSDLSQTTELLRLWHGIADGQDRLKVLAMVRGVSAGA